MVGNSSPVTSAQTGVSESLQAVVSKHLHTEFKKPLHSFSKTLFERLDEHVRKERRPVILDAGCGTGDSTLQLAKQYPEHLVVGIDKSQHRLNKYLNNKCIYFNGNLVLARADLVDIWRLLATTDWHIDKHFILCPNPWPKPEHLKRRWHGHPVFPILIGLSNELELRTNWSIYADEFKLALAIAGVDAIVAELEAHEMISPFENKYQQSGHQLYRLTSLC